MVANIRKLGAALALTLLLAGCISLQSKAPAELITLTSDNVAPPGAVSSDKVGDVLVVLDPATDRRLDVNRVPVQVNDSTIAYLKKATWVERPARQFRTLLAETIRAKTGRLVLEGTDIELKGKQVLSGRLLNMGYDARNRSVVVRYDAVLENADGSNLRSRRFESVVKRVSPNVKAVAPALNKAANDVAVQVAEWVS